VGTGNYISCNHLDKYKNIPLLSNLIINLL